MALEEEVIPLVEERAVVGKRLVETGRVRVSTRVEQRQEMVRAELARDEVAVERVPINRPVDAVPEIRQEGEVTIVPVVEEVLVVEKRLVLVEEIHLRRRRTIEEFAQPVMLATQRAEIVRTETGGEATQKPTK
jgi:uncharacterized protein (TIGR02271 family)